MSRYQHPYQQHCEPNGSCGCCEPQAESNDSAFLMPESNQEADNGD